MDADFFSHVNSMLQVIADSLFLSLSLCALVAGAITPAEVKLDATLKCVEACPDLVCQNACVYSAYNVPASAGVPTVSATVPGPIATTVSGAAPAATSAHTTSTTGSGANALHTGIFAAGIATLVASFVSFMV